MIEYLSHLCMVVCIQGVLHHMGQEGMQQGLNTLYSLLGERVSVMMFAGMTLMHTMVVSHARAHTRSHART